MNAHSTEMSGEHSVNSEKSWLDEKYFITLVSGVTLMVPLAIFGYQPSRLWSLSRLSKYPIIGAFTRMGTKRGDSRRKEIVNLVSGNPGVYLSQIIKMLGMGVGQTTHHLNRLESDGIIRSEKFGKRKCYFMLKVSGNDQESRNFEEIHHQLQPSDLQVINYFKNSDTFCGNQEDIANSLGLSQPTISRSFSRLLELGLISSTPVSEEISSIELTLKGRTIINSSLFDILANQETGSETASTQ